MVDERYISSSLLGLRQLSSEKTGDVVTFKLSSNLCNDYYASVFSPENNNNSSSSVNYNSSVNLTSHGSSLNLDKMSSSISLLGGSKSDVTKRIRRTGKYTPQEREITRLVDSFLCTKMNKLHNLYRYHILLFQLSH